MVAAWKEEMKRWKNILLISYVLLHLMWLAPRSVLKRAKIMIIMTTLFLQHKRCGARCLTSQRQCKYFSQQSQSMCKLYLYHKIEDINIPNDVSIHDIWIVLHNILKVQIYSINKASLFIHSTVYWQYTMQSPFSLLGREKMSTSRQDKMDD